MDLEYKRKPSKMQRRTEVEGLERRLNPGFPGDVHVFTRSLRDEIVESETGISPREFLSSLEFRSGYTTSASSSIPPLIPQHVII
jgi:hypothetical protein